MNLQPTLASTWIRLVPLREADFETLYNVASDPLIWTQHPNPDRYQRDVFRRYFDGAIQSGGAFQVLDARNDQPIGCTRYYNYNPELKSVLIGYTFLARSHWGGVFNPAMKQLMLEHAFTSVQTVLFHIGINNRRSRIAIERLGATFVRELEVAYHAEPLKQNVEYAITRDAYLSQHRLTTG